MKLKSLVSPRVLGPVLCGLIFVLIMAIFVKIVIRPVPAPDRTTISENRVTWEEISRHAYRTEVPTGWLVRTGQALTFVVDPEHEWLK